MLYTRWTRWNGDNPIHYWLNINAITPACIFSNMMDEHRGISSFIKSLSSSFTLQLPGVKVMTRNCHLSAQKLSGLPLSASEVGSLRCSCTFLFYMAQFCAQAVLSYCFSQKQKSLLVSEEEKGENRGERVQVWCTWLQTPKMSISDEIFTFIWVKLKQKKEVTTSDRFCHAYHYESYINISNLITSALLTCKWTWFKTIKY